LEGSISQHNPTHIRASFLNALAAWSLKVHSDYPSEHAATIVVAHMLGICSPQTIRTLIRRSEIKVGKRPSATTNTPLEIKKLQRQNIKFRQWSATLKTTAAFSAAALDRPHLNSGVESISSVLTERDVNITPSTFMTSAGAQSRRQSRRMSFENPSCWTPGHCNDSFSALEMNRPKFVRDS
jgi:transposase